MTRINTKTLRINRRKNIFMGQLPLNSLLKDINPSTLILSQDQIEKNKNQETTEEISHKSSLTWKIFDSSGQDLIPSCKEVVSTNEEIESDTFFLLVESSSDSLEIFPIQEYHKFNLDITNKLLNLKSSESAEKEAQQNVVKEADLTAKVLGLRKQESDDDSKPKKDKKKSSFTQFDDYGIKRQEIKQRKNVLKSKRGYTIKPNDYVDSVLHISSLRHNPGTWDYNEGERSDDEEDVLAPVASNNVEGFDEDDFVNKDNDLDSDDDPLSEYGQGVKALLKNQENQEVEDELNQYIDDEDETQNHNGEGQDINNSNEFSARQIHSIDDHTSKNIPMNDIEVKLLKTLMQNMGRMDVKSFMTQFISKEKEEDVSKIQGAILKMCTIQKEVFDGKNTQFISLKPKYRR